MPTVSEPRRWFGLPTTTWHVHTFELNTDGVLEVCLPREGHQSAQAKEALRRVESVLVALDAATAAITSRNP
jgi:hypothetical protein